MEDKVLFEEKKTKNGAVLGLATLNSEKSLNAIDTEMVKTLYVKLYDWRDRNDVVAVMLRGAGEKAFCAGGDVTKLYHSITESPGPDNEDVREFFEHEYRLDYLIHTYPKPTIVWGSGIVMGGGLGLLIGASHRVFTETSRLAMPEISIGLYPDVGGTWFLGKVPRGIGYFLALTGTPFNAWDAKKLGFGDYVLDSGSEKRCFDRLVELSWGVDLSSNNTLIGEVLENNTFRSEPVESKIEEHRGLLERVCIAESVSEFAEKLTQIEMGNRKGDPWLNKAILNFSNGSPTSARVMFEAIRRAKDLSLKEAFMQELVLSVQFAARPDFAEGVRARLIDKDQKPKWSPATLSEVQDEWVEEHFSSPWKDGQHPLHDL